MDDEEVIITESEVVHPILILPKMCTMLETNCDAADNVFIHVNITSQDIEGNQTNIYTGFCNVKIIDTNIADVHEDDDNGQCSDSNKTVISIITSEPSAQYTYPDSHSQMWIDEANPYMYNSYGATETEKRCALYHQTHSDHVTVEQHNTYITQNVYNCNEEVPYTPVKEFEHKKFRRASVSEANQVNTDPNLDELECGMFLSQLPEEIMIENENRAREELKYIGLQCENDALKQLMSPDIQSCSKHQRTILYLGHDSLDSQNIQDMSGNDPIVKCIDTRIDKEVVIDSRKPNPKKYPCAECKQTFYHITTFKKHMQQEHKIVNVTKWAQGSQSDLVCRICGKVLKSQKKFNLHCKGHGDPEVECGKCHKVFASKFTLRNHRKLHQKQNQCNYCTKSYYSVKDLKAHVAKMHFIYKCNNCDYTAQKYSELVQHKLSHNDDEIRISDSDPSLLFDEEWIDAADAVTPTLDDFSIISNYDDHPANLDVSEPDSVIAKVISNKVFHLHSKKTKQCRNRKICDVCCKKFDRVSDLKRHLIEHVIRSTLAKTPVNANGTLNIQCEVCQSETFSRIDRYKEHLREHAKLTLYKCIFCDKSFSDSSNFSKHKKVHGTTFFQCDLCQRKFNSKKTLTQHIDYHNNHSPLPCYYCDKVFHFPSLLKKHVKSTHKREMTRSKCRFCLEYFKSLKEKWDHEWFVHNVRKMIVDCLLCESKFRKYSELKRHCKNIHNVDIPPARKLLKNRKPS